MFHGKRMVLHGFALVLFVAVAGWTTSAIGGGPGGGTGGEGGPNIDVCYKGISGPAMVGGLTLTENSSGSSNYSLVFEGMCKNTRYLRYSDDTGLLPGGATFDNIVRTCQGNVDCQNKLSIQGFIFEADYAEITLEDGTPSSLPGIGCVSYAYLNPHSVIRLYVESALTFTTILNGDGTRTIESDVVLLHLVPYDTPPLGENCGY